MKVTEQEVFEALVVLDTCTIHEYKNHDVNTANIAPSLWALVALSLENHGLKSGHYYQCPLCYYELCQNHHRIVPKAGQVLLTAKCHSWARGVTLFWFLATSCPDTCFMKQSSFLADQSSKAFTIYQ